MFVLLCLTEIGYVVCILYYSLCTHQIRSRELVVQWSKTLASGLFEVHSLAVALVGDAQGDPVRISFGIVAAVRMRETPVRLRSSSWFFFVCMCEGRRGRSGGGWERS